MHWSQKGICGKFFQSLSVSQVFDSHEGLVQTEVFSAIWSVRQCIKLYLHSVFPPILLQPEIGLIRISVFVSDSLLAVL